MQAPTGKVVGCYKGHSFSKNPKLLQETLMLLRQACSVCSTGQHLFGYNRKETFACSGLPIDVQSASTKQARGRKAREALTRKAA